MGDSSARPTMESTSVVVSLESASVRPWSLYSTGRRWGLLGILFLVLMHNYVAMFVISVLLEPIKHELHVSDTALGLLTGVAFSLLYSVTALPVARWADRGNRRTVIALFVAGWSAMTAVSGLARSFWQLAFARLGLGAAASGALPPAQSLIADYFPPEERAIPLGVLNAAQNVGYMAGVGIGGYIAAVQGWRAAFALVGVFGLGLALIVRWTLSEPRSVLGFPAAVQTEGLWETLQQLRAKPSFVCVILGLSAWSIFAYGESTFLPSFMMRSLHASLKQVSATWAMAATLANVIGALVGGWLIKRLSSRDASWYGRLPAFTCLAGACLYVGAFVSTHLATFVAFGFLAEAILAMGAPAVLSVVHLVCGNQRRAIAFAILFLVTMICGNGLGPLTAGVFSDALRSAYGVGSLRCSLIILTMFLVPAAVAFLVSAQAIKRDLED